MQYYVALFHCFLQNDVVLSLERLKTEEKEYMERKKREEMEQAVLKQEDPEVEYKRRLVERFTYKNTDMIQRIYAENQVRTYSPGADAQKFEITIGTSKKRFKSIIWTIRSTKNIADTFEFSLGLRSAFPVVHQYLR